MAPVKNFTIEQIKEKRKEIDALIQFVSKEQDLGQEGINNADEQLYSMSGYQVIVHLTNAKMWLGKMLEGRGSELPAQYADKAEVQ